MSAQKKVEDISTLVPEHIAQKLAGLSLPQMKISLNPEALLAAEHLQREWADMGKQMREGMQVLGELLKTIDVSMQPIKYSFQNIVVHPAWASTAKALSDDYPVLVEFERDASGGKLGEIDDDEPAALYLAKYRALKRVCEGLPSKWAETPGDLLVSFSVALNDIPVNWAPSNPIKGFISLRSGKGAIKVNLPHKEAKSRALELARNLWAKDERLTKEELADKIVLVLRRDGYGERSVGMIMEWIKGAVPESRKKGGRPKKGI